MSDHINRIYRIILVLLIINISSLPALSDDIEWVDAQEKTLRFKESVSRNGYLIEATDFFGTSVLITVYSSNGSLLLRNVSRTGDYMTLNDDLNITILEVREKRGKIGANLGLNVIVDEWAKIQTRTAGRPVPKVSVVPYQKRINKRLNLSYEFISNSDIRINISAKNDGKAVFRSPKLKITSKLPLFERENLNYELVDIKGMNESDDITVLFKAPPADEKKSFTIQAELTGYDDFGKAYRSSDSINITVLPTSEREGKLDIRKYVSEKIYVGDVAVVSLDIKNHGSRKISNATLTEILPAGLEPVDKNLTWDLSFEPFESKMISYKIKPDKPGIYYFLPGSSRIEYNGILKSNPKINRLIVSGPYVILTKSASIFEAAKGEDVTVKIEAKNIGDATAIVKFVDVAPVNRSLSDTRKINIQDTLVVRPGKSESVSYTVYSNTAGSFQLSPVKAKVTDRFLYNEERYAQKITSNDLLINVRESRTDESIKSLITPLPVGTAKAIEPETTEIPQTKEPQKSPGFQGNMVLGIVFIIILIIKLRDCEKTK